MPKLPAPQKAKKRPKRITTANPPGGPRTPGAAKSGIRSKKRKR